MPLAAVLGADPKELSEFAEFSPKVSPGNTVVVETRSIAVREKPKIEKVGLRVITLKDLDMRGMKVITGETLEPACGGIEGFHCSLDLDVVDPQVVPGVGTPVHGDITYWENHLAMEVVADSGKLLAFDCVKVNPVLDTENGTGSVAVEFISSAWGKGIL